MNDFTKDELIIMHHNFAETEFRGTNEKLNGIRKKIQSLIDNYCEHEDTKFITDVGIDKCLKCGAVIHD